MELKTIQASNGVSVTGPTISGSGSGEFNVISSPNDASSGWAASGAGITVSTSTTTTDLPLGPNVSTSIKITPVSGTDYVYYRWTMPDALKNRKLKVQWEQRPLSGYASGDLEVEVYKNSASNYGGSYTRFDLSTDSSGVSSIPNASGRFNTNFDSDGADYYELRVTRVSGTTALNITSVIVGPGIQPQGAVKGPITSFTPVFRGSTTDPALGGGGSTKAFLVRDGEQAYINVSHLQNSGGTSGSGTYFFEMPFGLTINTSLFAGVANRNVIGKGWVGVGTGSMLPVTLRAESSTLVSVTIDNSVTAGTLWASGGTYDIGTVATLRFGFEIENVPIAEWAGSGTVNLAQNDVEYASTSGTWDADSSTTVYGPAGVIVGGTLTSSRNKTVTWITPAQRTDSQDVEFSYDQLVWFSSAVYAPYTQSSLGTDATSAGIQISNVTSTTTQVRFMRYRYLANDDSPATNWPASGLYWRVVKRSAGAAVGFGLATATASGLVSRESTGNLIFSAATDLLNIDSVTVTSASFVLIGGLYLVDISLDVNPTTAGTFAFRLALADFPGTTPKIHGVTFRNGNPAFLTNHCLANSGTYAGKVAFVGECSSTNGGIYHFNFSYKA